MKNSKYIARLETTCKESVESIVSQGKEDQPVDTKNKEAKSKKWE